ncbi:MAG: flagellar hook-basal body complex protein [Polaromonas sp.]|nr:flagellar hook-basal body complex protein [Polaromonas sp.]
MSFYTSLTGLNSASAQLGVTSNNIANVGTTGFKRSRADFGDIFATSPLQKSSSAIGQGVSLKQVSQEFSQGNISFSSNALDLAISGDGFFPLKSADGLQDIYTRNGAFMLNEQFNVVNSAGQRLMAATVDSTGSANVNERVVLTIPQTTVGEALETSQVVLGVNFPADAAVISDPFSRTNAASYNKSTALTVYDAGGNGYLATIYYVKTQNATQGSPFNKWQTYVYIGADEVKASLMQATDSNKEQLFVNKYGQTQPYSVVKDFLTNNAKTQMFSLDQLTDKQVSQAASITGAFSAKDLATGINFSTLIAAEKLALPASTASLSNLFKIEVDGSSVNVDLSHLSKSSTPLTGTQIASELTNYLNTKFGDDRYFEFPDLASSKLTLTVGTGVATALDLGYAVAAKKTTAEVLADLQTKVAAAYPPVAPATVSAITVSYDATARTFKFVDSTVPARTIAVSAPAANTVFGLTTTAVTLADTGLMPNQVSPNSESYIRPVVDQRFGMKVTYNTGDKTFSFASGTTGDTSTISITPIDPVTGLETTDALINPLAASIFGLKKSAVIASPLALRGITSTPAVAYGTSPSINMNNNFSVTAENNTFIVTVDDVRGTVTIPVGGDYSLARFKKELQTQINLLADSTGKTVNGVKVNFDTITEKFSFTTSTATSASFIKVTGKGPWGLEETQSGLGVTSSWIKPTQFTDTSSGTGKLVYIDEFGMETTNGDGFLTSPVWTPIYLDKGELTFDTGGNLVSPVAGSQLETVFLEDGKGALTINIDYSKSTQYTSPFAVLSQSQDGAPEGDLVGVTIGNDGLVSASYSNGTQKSLAKILLVNFSNPTGLRQVGDSSFLSSAASGNAILGTAGGAGFGTIRAGATERSNVDLTAELVDLITAQRNFQANAKAIETSTTMTQAIINIRG